MVVNNRYVHDFLMLTFGLISLSGYWGRIVVWYQQLPIMMAAAIQRQLVAIQLHAQHNLHVILQIIIHTARQAITNICKNMTVIVTVTPPPS